MGAVLGWFFASIPNEQRRILAINIDLCLPEWDARSRARLVRRSLIESGKTVFETGPLWLWGKERALSLVAKVSGEGYVADAMKSGKGVILAIPHLGAWEMIGVYCSTRYPMTSLYRPPKIAALDDFVRSARERFGATLVPTDASGVRALHRALNRGELVAILPDQVPMPGKGVFAGFFGMSAYTMVLLSRLAARTGATVLFTYAERLPKGKGFHLHFIEASPAIYHPDPAISAAAVNQGVELCIRGLPEQYQWMYKRFRLRPEGSPSVY